MSITTLHGDCREQLQTLPAGSVQCVVTSPPYYGLRKYSDDPREIGQEATPTEYVQALVDVFRQVRRVLRDDGTVWLNLGDSYGRGKRVRWAGDARRGANRRAAWDGHYSEVKAEEPEKQLLRIPWRVAEALQNDGWVLRTEVIWDKTNGGGESMNDRPRRSHEYIFLLSKRTHYYFDFESMAAHNPQCKGAIWRFPCASYKGDHFAVMPEQLIAPCVLASSRVGDTVLDPFAGSGTVQRVATRYQRDAIGIELNADYITDHIETRTDGVQVELFV